MDKIDKIVDFCKCREGGNTAATATQLNNVSKGTTSGSTKNICGLIELSFESGYLIRNADGC